MNNTEIIDNFYSAFADKKADEMVSYYADDVLFEDPAFGILRGERAKSMWRMLIERGGENLTITYKNVKGEGNLGSAHWTATYFYGPAKRKVVNEIDAYFTFADSKIVTHKDVFNMWKWSSMALGLPGTLLGWSGFLQQKVRTQANKTLDKYLTFRNT